MLQYCDFHGPHRCGAARQVDDHFVVAGVPAKAGHVFLDAFVQDGPAQLLGTVDAQVVHVGGVAVMWRGCHGYLAPISAQ